MIPQCTRVEILNELHATHMCAEGMKRLARGKFTWKNMGKDIQRRYSQCEMCLEHSRSKPNIPGKRNEVIPSNLELACAGEMLSADFGQFGRNNLLIVKDRFSGLLRVYLMPDKTMKSAAKGIEKWAHSYGICREVRTDGDPAFGQEFSEYCRGLV